MVQADSKANCTEWQKIERFLALNKKMDKMEKRMHLQQQLLNQAIFILRKKKRDIPIVFEDEKLGLTIHQQWEDNTPLTIGEIKAEGLVPE